MPRAASSARLPVFRSFPRIFEEKRDCSQSRDNAPINVKPAGGEAGHRAGI